jgi:hypothetical protein
MIVTLGAPASRGGGARMMRRVRSARLREYNDGYYPVPGWSYSPDAPLMPPAAGGARCGRKSLGDGTDYLSDNINFFDNSTTGTGLLTNLPTSATGTGSVLTPGPGMPGTSGQPIAAPVVTEYPASPGGSMISSQQLAQLAQTPGIPLPTVSPATLLAAAALPNAPAIVKQAAAQYQAANPVSGFLSGTIFGLPSYLVLGGGLLALLAFAAKR